MNEKAAVRDVFWPEKRVRKNLRLQIKSEKAPKLDWLTEKHADWIISLQKPPAESTQNLKRLERLTTPVAGLDPKVLKRAARVKWLYIHCEDAPTKEWLQSLRNTVKNSLTALKCLELQAQDEEGNKGKLQTAKKRDEMLDMLDRLSADPSSLESK